MAWLVLIISGMFEAVWATALGKSEGFTRLWPTVLFFVGAAVSMGGLGWALKTIPTGTGYAAWVGIGAVTTVVVAMVSGAEPASWVRILLITGLIACVAGLKLTTPEVSA